MQHVTNPGYHYQAVTLSQTTRSSLVPGSQARSSHSFSADCWIQHTNHMEDGRAPNTFFTVMWPPVKDDWDSPSSASKMSACKIQRCSTLEGNRWKELASYRSQWRQELGRALKRGESKQLRAADRRRARWKKAEQQPHQSQPTGADAAAETVTFEWACTVTSGAAPLTLLSEAHIHDLWRVKEGNHSITKQNMAFL